MWDLLRLPWVAQGPRHYLEDDRESQWLSPRALRDRQHAGLRRTTWHCFLHVPYFAHSISRVLRPHEIESLDDVTRLPLVLASERRDDPDAFVATPVERDEEWIARQAALEMRAIEWLGTSAGDWVTPETGRIASVCQFGALHLHADHFLVEAIDDAGRPLPPGARGRLFLTDLHRRASPFLRHELCTEGRVVPDPCECGRVLPLVEVMGR